MKDEYIIINKAAIQKRIEELKMECENPSTQWHDRKAKSLEIISLQEILSQSTPLIPELKKAYEEGFYSANTDSPVKDSQIYISNLKLDI